MRINKLAGSPLWIGIHPGLTEALWRPFCQQLEATLENTPHIFKNDNTSTVWLAHVGKQAVIVKRINSLTLLQKIKRCFRPSRPRKNWAYAEHLRELGINTFKPLAIVEERRGPFCWGRAYLVCEYLKGESALQLFAEGAKPEANWPTRLEGLVSVLFALKKHGLSHRDLNPSNLILQDEQWYLIDLDAMRQHKFAFCAKKYFERECRRFIENWEDAEDTDTVLLPMIKQFIDKWRILSRT